MGLTLMTDVDDLLEKLESDDPRDAIRESKEVFEEEKLSEDDESRLAYGIATGYFKIGIYGDSLDWLEKTDSDRRWMLRGFCHMNLSDPRKARECFLDSAKNHSENAKEALLLAAQCLAMIEKYKAAIKELEKLLEQDIPPRQRAEIWFNIGLIYEEQDELDEAEEIFEKITHELEGDYFVLEALFHLARLHEETDQIDAAMECANQLEDYVQPNSENEEVLENLKNRLRKQKKDRTDQLRDYDF